MVDKKRFNPLDWHKLGNWPSYLLGPEFWFGKYFSDEFYKIFGKRPIGLFYFDGKQCHQFFSKQTASSIKKKFESIQTKQFFLQLLNDFHKNKMELFSGKKEFESLQESERLPFLKEKIFPIYARNAVYDWIVFLYEQLYHGEIYEEYKKIRQKKCVQEVPKLITPSIKTDNIKSQIAILKEALRIKKGKSIKDSAKILANEFGFLPIFHMNDPNDELYYRTVLKKVIEEQSEKDIKRELDNLENYPHTVNKEYEELINKIDVPQELIDKLNILRICAKVRTLSDEFVSVVGLLFRKIFKPLADFLNIKYPDLFFLTSSEIMKLYHDKRLNQNVIDMRKNSFVAYSNESFELDVKSGSEAKKIISEFSAEMIKSVEKKKIEGVVACPGKIIGIVNKVVGDNINKPFKENEILVAHATTVQFVPIMGKAGAIITDYGGLTSHAAIVAREMKKPCIVGTKIATRALHDGDLVEVDANDGIVKILKRK